MKLMKFKIEKTIVYKLMDEWGNVIRYGETLEREFKARMRRHKQNAEASNRRITYEAICRFPMKKQAKRKETTLIKAYRKRYGYLPGNRPGDLHPCRNRIVR